MEAVRRRKGPRRGEEHFLTSWRVTSGSSRITDSETILISSSIKGNRFSHRCQRRGLGFSSSLARRVSRPTEVSSVPSERSGPEHVSQQDLERRCSWPFPGDESRKPPTTQRAFLRRISALAIGSLLSSSPVTHLILWQWSGRGSPRTRRQR